MSSRPQNGVKTTLDKVSIYTARFALRGVTGSLINSTDMVCSVSGTGPTATDATGGRVTVTLDDANRYPQLLHWECSLDAPNGQVGVYRLEKIGASPTDGTFTMRLMSGTTPQAGNAIPGVGVYEMSAAVNSGAGLTGSLYAVFRNTNRTA